MFRQHAMRVIDKDLQTIAATRLAALRRAARARELQLRHPVPSADVADEHLAAHSGWEFLLQVPA